MESPFQYGTIAQNENFIDRVEERALLKQLLSSGVNVMLISPRRWGKSSLVKNAMDELTREKKNIKVCYIDAFSINSEAEFYRTFASRVMSCAKSLNISKALSNPIGRAIFFFLILSKCFCALSRRFLEGISTLNSWVFLIAVAIEFRTFSSCRFENSNVLPAFLSMATWKVRCGRCGNNSN